MSKKTFIKVAIADDHKLVCSALALLLKNFGRYTVLFTASNGLEAAEKLKQGLIPDVLVVDMDMPQMDGHDTAVWVHKKFPKVHILMLTAYNSDALLIKLVKAGVSGFMQKGSEDYEFDLAIQSIMKKGFYYNNEIAGKIFKNTVSEKEIPKLTQFSLSKEELQFIKLSCSELPYKQIYLKMRISPGNGEHLRQDIFDKLGVTSRVGLVLFAIRNAIVFPSDC